MVVPTQSKHPRQQKVRKDKKKSQEFSPFCGEGQIQVKKTLTRADCLQKGIPLNWLGKGLRGRLAQGHERKVCTWGRGPTHFITRDSVPAPTREGPQGPQSPQHAAGPETADQEISRLCKPLQ